MKFFIVIFAFILTNTEVAQALELKKNDEKANLNLAQINDKMSNNMSILQIGAVAPDFNLPTQEDKKFIKLSDLRGKNVVLYFYPKDNTPGCTIEAKEFNSLKEEFNKLNTVVFGVSKDDEKSHKNFAEKYCLTFDLLSDVNGEVSTSYGVLVEKSMFGKKYMGLQRATFLIDTEGKILHIWPKAGFMWHAKEVLKEVEKIKN